MELTRPFKQISNKFSLNFIDDAWRESDAALAREQEIQEQFQEVLTRCEKFEQKDAEKQDENAE